jgi:glycine cleavage system P protein (glycine dehydrogenase) subunit 2
METKCPDCRENIELIFEKSVTGHRGYEPPTMDIDGPELSDLIPASYLRPQAPQLPEVTEPEVVRHYITLSTLNHHVDKGFYPLGSCTMKYNPKINEDIARMPDLAGLHPDAPQWLVQGILGLIWRLEQDLMALTGLHAVSMQPSAGAQGEMLGMLLFRAYHDHKGNRKHVILIPDSAHGTNPASVVQCGFTPEKIASRPDGRIDLDALANVIDESTAGIMITNPSTLGLFEEDMGRISELIHGVDGLVYMDGANLNALMGLCRPGDMGVDALHMNLHKTFTTPHGGGGPGAGPVAVSERLVPFLPVPRVIKEDDEFRIEHEGEHALGNLHPYYGNVGVMIRALTYILQMGGEGLTAASRAAIVNANYLMKKVDPVFPVSKGDKCMHEFVSDLSWTRKHGVTNIDVAKRLLDYGFHAPTVSFPLIVPDAFMIEPTETETRETLDRFAATLAIIAAEIRENPELVHTAPHNLPVCRLDEAVAARQLNVTWSPTCKGSNA